MASLAAGDTFLIVTNIDDGKMHLQIVLCDPYGNPAKVLAAPLNTLTSVADRTVVLNAGDHPFIKHATYVNYSRMLELPVQEILSLESRGNPNFFQRHAPLADSLLERILHGALASPLTPKRMIGVLKQRLGLSD